MRTKESMIEPLYPSEEVLAKAIETAEDGRHILREYIQDIIDEVGDILHDDLRFKKRIINKAFVNPEVREKIKEELCTFIIGH